MFNPKDFPPTIPIFGLIIIVIFCFFSLPTKAASVTQMFGQALKVYDLGNYRQAAKLLNDIVKKYPTHEPSHILLARIYYKSGVMGRAAWHFRRVSLDSLDGISAYEYGMTFFSRGQCNLADQGLRRVGPKSRGTNLAYFYRGVCYSRSKQWYRAEQFIEKAQDLPPHLLGIRRKLLSQVRQAQEREQKIQQTESQQQIMTQTMTPPPLVLAPPALDVIQSETYLKGTKDPKTTTKKEVLKVGLTTSIAPDLSMTIQSSDSDFNGTQSQHMDSNIIKLGALGTFKQLFPPVKNGDQPYGSLVLAFSQVSTDTSGKKVKNQAYADAPDQSFETTINQPKVSSHILRFSGTTELGYPVLSSTDVTVGAKVEALKPQETTIPSATGQSGNGSTSITKGAISLKGTGEYSQYQIEDPKSPTTKGFTRMRGSGSITQNWSNGFFLEFNGIYAVYTQATLAPAGPTYIGDINSSKSLMNGTTFDGNSLEFGGAAGKKFEIAKFKTKVSQTSYSPTNEAQFLDGANDILMIDASLEINFEMGSSIVLNGSSQEIGSYQKEIDKPAADPTTLALKYRGLLTQSDTPPPEKVIAASTANKTSASASLKMAPLEGLTGKMTLGYDQITLRVAKKELEETLLKSTPSSSMSVLFEIGFNRSF